jgi:hypothetical protein
MLYVQWECVSVANMSSMMINSVDEMTLGMHPDEMEKLHGLGATSTPHLNLTTTHPPYCEDDPVILCYDYMITFTQTFLTRSMKMYFFI